MPAHPVLLVNPYQMENPVMDTVHTFAVRTFSHTFTHTNGKPMTF